MIYQERIKNWKLHDSLRGVFGFELYKQMSENKDIVLIILDLGFGLFDAHREDFPDRAFNVGASEQAGMDIAVGMALSGKKVFIYSITPFLIYRAFETLRTYVDHEKIPVRLVGSGRNKDYEIDGFSHDASDLIPILNKLSNITQYFPSDKNEIPLLVEKMVATNQPQFISLKR